jgi:hypothetical protein
MEHYPALGILQKNESSFCKKEFEKNVNLPQESLWFRDFALPSRAASDGSK